jgi:hypothetical protein
VAAQDQRVEFLFAAQVSGQAELKKLTDAVDGLRKEMEALKAANGGVGAATQQFTRSLGNASSHVQAYRKHLDAQAKAMRNNRIGTMQAGMQVNDFVTSVSTGASPIQAFNQQIGQVGYAMQLMGGTAGKIGNFLAGPWSILVIGASMAIGALIEGFFGAEDASKKAKNATIDLADSFDFASASSETLAKLNEALADANKDVAATAIQAANATAKKAAADATAAQEALNLANAELTKRKAVLTALKTPTAFAGGGVAGAALTAGQFATNRQNKAIDEQLDKVNGLEKSIAGLQFRNRKFTAESYSLSAAMDANGKVIEKHNARIADLQNQYAAGTISQAQLVNGLNAENAAIRKLEDTKKGGGRKRTGKSEAEKAQEKELKSIESFMDKIGRVGMKELPAYQRDIAQLEKDFFELSKAGQAATIAPFKAAVESIEMRAYSDALKDDLKDADKMVKDALPNMGELPVSKEMAEIISRTEELNDSFEEIGNTVSEAFKGMLTGAMSWKDGMRSLISSVIDQLWKLFVVQKIVGLVTGALGGATGTPTSFSPTTSVTPPSGFIPFNAYGGSVMGNKPTIVGERGPELFIPSGNGTIIPNSNMRGGGGGSPISISVDARGSSDPAAVRAQVQQGILEAAPAIIAAAESRTIAGLRRPRLGGAMQ